MSLPTNPLEHIRVKMARADLGRVLNASVGSVEIGGVLLVYFFLWFRSLLSLSLIKSQC